jgi:hypothetical protein
MNWFLVFFNPTNLANLCFIIVVIIGFSEPYVYSLLLLHILRISPILVSILKSVTINKKSLMLTTILGLIIVYIFAIIAFLSLG